MPIYFVPPLHHMLKEPPGLYLVKGWMLQSNRPVRLVVTGSPCDIVGVTAEVSG